MNRSRACVLTALIVGLALLAQSCGRVRAAADDDSLSRQRRERAAEFRAETAGSFEGIIDRVAGSEGRERPLDILVLSGGGDYGAFGAGVLSGWREVKGECALPEFDAVSGVSAGALIAPFAFLGTASGAAQEDLDLLESLFRHPKPDWVLSRGVLAFLPDNESLAETPGLERELRNALDADRIRRIADEGVKGRRLYVNATDLDLGVARPFELTRAARLAGESGDLSRLHRILLASAGIPGAFPPREIDGVLYVDGGVSSNIIYGAWNSREDSFPAQFRKRHPTLPRPHIRYWVIINNQVQTPARTVQPGWISVVQRSVEVAIRSSTVTSLRHLLAFAQMNSLRGDADVEVRWIAIPEDWRAPVPGVFATKTMNDLVDLGRRLGADPSSWRRGDP